MLVTVVTLEDGARAEHYVDVVEGKISPETRRQMARCYNALLWHEVPEAERQESEDQRWLWFREIRTTKTHALRFLNIDDHSSSASHD